MRIGLFAATAMMAMAASSMAGAYELCAKVHTLPQSLQTFSGTLKVGTTTFSINYKTGNSEECVLGGVPGTVTGQVSARASAGQYSSFTDCSDTVVPAGNTGKIVVQVYIVYIRENVQSPYYVQSCTRG